MLTSLPRSIGMRTEVKLFFAGDHFPGGARAILGAAGCGPDVAVVEDTPALRRKEDVAVTLDASDKRLTILLDLLAQHGMSWSELRRDHYTTEELDAARLIIMDPLRPDTVFGGPRMGTTYNLENACTRCGAGARQTSALIMDGEDLPRLEGRRAASTPYSDIIVDERLAEELVNLDATGLSFRNVYAAMENKRQVKLRWRQLRAAHTLPPMSPRSTGVERRDGCASCGRSGFFTKMNDPPRLVYRAQDLAMAEDVNTTWEWFENWDFNGDVSEALFPYPWMLVTPKVMRVIRAAGVTEIDWIPIRVVDE
jgi:hypothetical protein